MISIIVYSSDGYADCWEPFFTLFKKNFTIEDSYEIILLTNTLNFEFTGLNIKTLANGIDTPWSKRLKTGIEKAKNDIIFLIGDDFFLLDKINDKHFDEQLALIKENQDVDHIRLLHKQGKFKSRPSKFSNLNIIDEKTKYRFLYAPSLWKKESLLQYIVDFESPFMAEKMSTYRSRILKHGFYCMSDDYIETHGPIYGCGTSGLIVKGKWAEWAVKVIEDKKLKIDVSKRGIRVEKEKKGAIFKARMYQILNPLSTYRSYLSIFELYLKSVFGKT